MEDESLEQRVGEEKKRVNGRHQLRVIVGLGSVAALALIGMYVSLKNISENISEDIKQKHPEGIVKVRVSESEVYNPDCLVCTIQYGGMPNQEVFSMVETHCDGLGCNSKSLFYPLDAKEILYDKSKFEILEVNKDYLKVKWLGGKKGE